MINNRVELLAPSGNWDCVRAAVSNGADAVYLGGKLFNARAYASNFSIEDLNDVCDYCHSHEAKVYVTVNTLYKDSEFAELIPFVGELHDMGVDGLIMQDLGAIDVVRRLWPDLPVHASTQLTANSLADVKQMEKMGLSTVVLSRELNLDEIREITANTKMRVETFIHGALCVSYSGQCLMSSVLGKRSGNRGKCAQNCRLNYKLESEGKTITEGHLLSTKDICTLDLLPEIIESGVSSMKIEGRMKSPEYVAGVTAIYRKYLDMYYEDPAHYQVDEADREILKQLFNRGGFSKGYFNTHSGMDMMCPVHPRNWGVHVGTVTRYADGKVTFKCDRPLNNGDGIEIWTENEEGVGCYINKPCHPGLNTISLKGEIKAGMEVYQTYNKELADRLSATIGKGGRKIHVSGFMKLRTGEPVQLTLSAGKLRASAEGAITEKALNQPLNEEFVRDQIARMGNTVFELDNLKVVMDKDCYINRKELNAVRNAACEKLHEVIISSYKREHIDVQLENPTVLPFEKQMISVSVETDEQLEAVMDMDDVDTIYLPASRLFENDGDRLISRVHEGGRKLVIKLPRVWRRYVYENYDWAMLEKADGFLISCLGHLESVHDRHKDIYLDFTDNVLNSFSYDFWKRAGVNRIAMSVEASTEEMIESQDSEVLAYGRIPLMVTHQCPIGNFAGFKKNHQYCAKAHHQQQYMLVQGNREFPLSTDCHDCVCTIYSPKPLNETATVRNLKTGHIRYNFTLESPAEIKRILGMDLSDGYYRKGIE